MSTHSVMFADTTGCEGHTHGSDTAVSSVRSAMQPRVEDAPSEDDSDSGKTTTVTAKRDDQELTTIDVGSNVTLGGGSTSIATDTEVPEDKDEIIARLRAELEESRVDRASDKSGFKECLAWKNARIERLEKTNKDLETELGEEREKTKKRDIQLSEWCDHDRSIEAKVRMYQGHNLIRANQEMRSEWTSPRTRAEAQESPADRSARRADEILSAIGRSSVGRQGFPFGPRHSFFDGQR